MRTLPDRLRRVHREAVWIAQVAIFAASGLWAFLLRFDLGLPHTYLRALLWGVAVWVVVKSVVFRAFGLDRGWWTYVSLRDMVRLAEGNLAASVLGCCVLLALSPVKLPRSVYPLDLMLCFLGTAAIRVAVRVLAENAPRSSDSQPRRTALIYGAGQAGIMLMREIHTNPRLPYRVRGFIDDMPEKKGARILGLPVLGSGKDLSAVVLRHKVEVVLVAIPSATGDAMTRILEICHAVHVECRTVPGLGDLIQGRGLAGQIREVAVEDLLGRTQVNLQEDGICHAIRGKVILVTGAGGSIGSEICRQIAHFSPAAIVGFDCAESALFEVDREIRATHPGVHFRAEIGSIQNRPRLEEVFSCHAPNAVYHAAAYKHVPLMETHVFEAVENNVLGTWNVATLASDYAAEDFVLISTDKAVAPTSMMGATKRITELMILGLQGGETKYVAVRFGNVLGSNGSVIPIFKKQIASGGPVTVTHPEMRRFFMTIPEACQLVLQASAIAEGGQIFVLDMGQPVKIVDLARKLILLSGLKPDEDIRIEFTGIRPGEKLLEELNSSTEDTIPSAHEKIRVFAGSSASNGEALRAVEQLRDVCQRRDMSELILLVKELVVDYNPSAQFLRRIVKTSQETDNGLPFRRPVHALRAPSYRVTVPTGND
jgi:FlaA1/EpsC-like NDP-sugar epimerase